MKTWTDYKEYVKMIDPESKKDIEEAEALAAADFIENGPSE